MSLVIRLFIKLSIDSNQLSKREIMEGMDQIWIKYFKSGLTSLSQSKNLIKKNQSNYLHASCK